MCHLDVMWSHLAFYVIIPDHQWGLSQMDFPCQSEGLTLPTQILCPVDRVPSTVYSLIFGTGTKLDRNHISTCP